MQHSVWLDEGVFYFHSADCATLSEMTDEAFVFNDAVYSFKATFRSVYLEHWYIYKMISKFNGYDKNLFKYQHISIYRNSWIRSTYHISKGVISRSIKVF